MRTKGTRLNQAGIASILFTMIMVIVISLIVLSFAQVARRGQREALDSQLSTQAYYAAESGVNEVQRVLAGITDNPGANYENEGCGITNPTYNSVITWLSDNVNLSCFKVTTKLPNLSATDIAPGESQMLYIEPEGNLDRLTITWKPARDPAPDNSLSRCPQPGARGIGDFKPPATWGCPYSVLRVDLVPIDTRMDRTSLLFDTMTTYAVPSASGTASSTPYIVPGGVVKGARSDGGCNNDLCTINITGLTHGKTYAMRIMSLYFMTPQVTVTGNPGVNFKNGQALIDVTGKAQDVMRRVQVRVPISRIGGGTADYAIGTRDSICKRFTLNENEFVNDPDCPTDFSTGEAVETCGFAGCEDPGDGGGDPIRVPPKDPIRGSRN